ncbi:hypothetical protein CBR_g38975 [Chara braunii]|uniref:Uncharacterized protein n=1 Tax=Chara braunii TaxID=69332 RepID=A0A388K130_CHABU|nr:hypothetical protein CBR_g38975 [Chara braunii]|eukprot:GBG63663.1 hypothetical protein CBR_g38975 [Chara braunii]
MGERSVHNWNMCRSLQYITFLRTSVTSHHSFCGVESSAIMMRSRLVVRERSLRTYVEKRVVRMLSHFPDVAAHQAGPGLEAAAVALSSLFNHKSRAAAS